MSSGVDVGSVSEVALSNAVGRTEMSLSESDDVILAKALPA